MGDLKGRSVNCCESPGPHLELSMFLCIYVSIYVFIYVFIFFDSDLYVMWEPQHVWGQCTLCVLTLYLVAYVM